MKVTEMLSLLSAFDEVYASSFLTEKEKAVIGTEVLLRLPHEGLYPSADATLKAIQRSIGERVTQLEGTLGAATEKATSKPTKGNTKVKDAGVRGVS
jgi:hypothetical protein